jgi:hypothetical protein
MDEQITAEMPDEGQLIETARKEYNDAIDTWRQNRERMEDDLRFVFEDQWDERDRRERETANLPCFEINDMPQFISQVAGDVRINRPQIEVHPVGSEDRATADVLEGMIRSIEQASGAHRVYADAVEYGSLACGMGHWRLSLEHADDEAFDVDVRIRRIQNPLSVVWDPNAKNPDMSDAKYCFVIKEIPKADFDEAYDVASASGYYTDHRVDGEWRKANTVTVAEYWTVEQREEVIVQLGDGRTVPIDQVPAGIPILRQKTVKRPDVKMHIITGREILEGPFNWPGKRIPIFTAWGRSGWVGESRVIKSLIHNAKDSARMYNYSASIAAENVSRSPKAKWLGTAAMFEGMENEWRDANRTRTDALVYNPDPESPSGKPEMIPPIPVDAGLAQERANASEDKKRTIGIYDASLGQRSNETSGVAIQRRDQQADIANYVFTDNLNLAIEATGRELVQVMPKVYSTPRQLRVLGPDMKAQIVKVNQLGGVDLSQGKHDVVINSGPGFNTRRQESAAFYQEFIRSNPQFAPFVAPMIVKNMDYPGYEEFEQVIMQALQMMNQPPPPNPADELNAAKDQQDLIGKQLLNTQRALDLRERNAFGAGPSPVRPVNLPQLTGSL